MPRWPGRIPWIPILVAVLAGLIAAGVWWYTGSMPEDSSKTSYRMVTLGLMLAVQGGVMLAWFVKVSKEPVAPPSPASAARADVRALLARAARASGRAFPWPWRPTERRAVLLLGSAGAGKTRLVRAQGGLVRALDGSGGLPSESPTVTVAPVLCEDVVVVDTAGRFVDGGPQDAEEWGVLLDALRRDRRLPAVEAVVLVVRAGTLLQRSEAERLAWIDRVTQRLVEVERRLRARLPLHIVVSHMDEVAGFGALVSGLDATDRSRPLGRRLRPTAAGADAVRREMVTELDGLRRALDRAVQERMGAVRTEGGRGDLLALPAELGAMERALGELVLRASASVDARGLWWIGEAGVGRPGSVGSALAAGLGIDPPERGRPTPSAPAFVTGLLRGEVARRGGGATATYVAANRQRSAWALGSALAMLFVGGLVLFTFTRRELRHLDELSGGLGTLAEIDAAVRADVKADPWEGTGRALVGLADALWPDRLEAVRAAELPDVAEREPTGTTSRFSVASGAADAAASAAVARATDRWLLGEARDTLMQRATASSSALAQADLRAERLGRSETEAMLVALDTHALAQAWSAVAEGGFGEQPALCGIPSLAALCVRTAGVRSTGDVALDRDVALLLAARVNTLSRPLGWEEAEAARAFTRLGGLVDGIRPEVRTFNAMLAQVGEAVAAPPASEGLDAGTWTADGLDWRPQGLDGPGCVAFQEAVAGGGGPGACSATAADPAKVAALYASHHEDQWRTWLSHLVLADVNDRPAESPNEIASELRRVFGPGRELDKVLQRLGRGDRAADACAVEAPPASCCACACATRPWSLAHQLGAGGVEAWGVLQKSADELAAQLDGLDGAKAAPLVAATLQGTGPFVALHDASRRVVTTVVAKPAELPAGCTCESAPSTLAEAEVRARIEALTTALLSRGWLQVLKRYEEHLHGLWRDEVLAAWQPLAGRFPFDASAVDEAAPADVAAFVGCAGKLGVFLTTHLRPLASGRQAPWGRAASLEWSPAARALLDGFDVICRRADGADKPKRVQLGMQYVAEDPPGDMVGMRVTVDGRALTYRFGQALEGLLMQRATLVQIEAMRGNPPKVRCPRYAATSGDWPLYRLLARPLVEQVRKAPPYDQKGLSFAPPADREQCGNASFAPHRLTYQEEAEGPAAVFYTLSHLEVPERLFTVEAPR